MSKIIGIDLGTTNSLVATIEAGLPYVMADRQGQRLTPSVVHFPPPPAMPIVGRDATHLRIIHPAETVYSVKRFIGRRFSEIGPEELKISYLLKPGSSGVAIEVYGESHSPEEVCAEILKKLKEDATVSLGEPVTRAVITVPAYFNDSQRQATKRAGELAGLTVERILNEPTAAALAYGLDKLQDHARIAVYDLGGGTFDLSILELNKGVFEVLATNGHTRLGGDDLDQRLVDFLTEKILAQGGPNIASDPSSIAQIRQVAEETKIKLSSSTEVPISIPFLSANFNFHFVMSRAELEAITRDIVLRTRVHCLQALADAKTKPQELSQVILVGGQTRMPLVRQFVAKLFECAEFEEERGMLRLGRGFHGQSGPQLNTSQNPDEVVALGAAVQAEILSGGFKNLLLLDVTPLSLGLETFGGLMNVIIPRNSTIPVKAGEVFTTAIDNQSTMLIHILQGERERAKDNWSLGRFTFDFQPAHRGVARVGVQFQINADGILQVLARDITTGKEVEVKLASAVDVDDWQVQKMVETSVEFAFADLKARQWVEGRLRAVDILTATQKALADCGLNLEGGYRTQVEAAMKAVENRISAGEADSAPEDPAALQVAVDHLDQATQHLAELQMDRVMEGLLRQKGLLTEQPAAGQSREGSASPGPTR